MTKNERLSNSPKTPFYSCYYPDTLAIVYWRDSTTEKEVDIIVRSSQYTFPFEVKYQENPRLREQSGLVAFCMLEWGKRPTR